MWHQPIGRAFRADFRRGFAEGKGFALGEDIGQQLVVLLAQRVERLAERDEVARDQPRSLMDQLIEGMLAVGARFAPVDRPCTHPTGSPARVTRLPLLSIVNCCR